MIPELAECAHHFQFTETDSLDFKSQMGESRDLP